jgi:hypothetical protein
MSGDFFRHINNKSLKPNAYQRDFQPHYASKGFGKCILPCWPGIGLAQALVGCMDKWGLPQNRTGLK